MRKLVVLILVSIVGCFAGCDSSGHDLYFVCAEMPTEISLKAGKENGEEPKAIKGEEGRRSYAIRLDENGAAVIRSDWVVTRYHRTFIKLPSITMREGHGFEWTGLPTIRPNNKSVREGEVTSTTTLEGTVYRYTIRTKNDTK